MCPAGGQRWAGGIINLPACHPHLHLHNKLPSHGGGRVDTVPGTSSCSCQCLLLQEGMGMDGEEEALKLELADMVQGLLDSHPLPPPSPHLFQK